MTRSILSLKAYGLTHDDEQELLICLEDIRNSGLTSFKID